LLALCYDESVSSKVALDLSINQIKIALGSQQRPDNASMETIGQLGEHIMPQKHLSKCIMGIK